jgi:GDP-D-mannose dehydratase
MTVRKALVTGITDHDGSYLAELLLAKGHELGFVTGTSFAEGLRRTIEWYTAARSSASASRAT